MNKIIQYMLDSRKGHYCHVIEVSTVYELESCIEQTAWDFENFSFQEFLEFWGSIAVYYLEDETLTKKENEENENLVYDFNIRKHIIKYLGHEDFDK